jgi:hypothetical protein
VNIWSQFISALSCVFVLFLGGPNPAQAAQHTSPKTPKTVVTAIATGPTGPIPQIPLDSIPALPPQVTYQNKSLTIIAPNSTLSEILIAVQEKTGAEITIPVASDRVVTRLGPGRAADILSELLTGSHFNFVLVSSPADASVLKRVVLLPKSSGDAVAKQAATAQNAPVSQAAATRQQVQDQPEEPQGMLETPDEP